MSRIGLVSLFIGLTAMTAGCSSTYKASSTTGLKTRTVFAGDTDQFGYTAGSGVMVAAVSESSEAYTKGVRETDLIKSVNGKAVNSPKEFEAAVMSAADGSSINLKVANAKKQEKDLSVKKQEPKDGGKMTFGISFPFLLFREPNGTALGHFNILRFRNKPGEHGIMILEVLGWAKKPGAWGVRLLCFHFGSASIKPGPGQNPDI